MIEITAWMNRFLKALNETFRDRVWFVGVQGSYARNEATETSDIDVVVVLDELTASDLQTYGAMLDTLPHRDMICGFLSGKEELLNWEPSDLFQFYYDTKPIQGSLDGLLALLDANTVNRSIKIGVCNIFHGCVHNMLHEKSDEILKGLYKSAVFVVQAICFQQAGKYMCNHSELLELAPREEKMIVKTFADLKAGGAVHFQEYSETLLTWSQKWIVATK